MAANDKVGLPEVSIGIPTRNGMPVLSRLLEQIFRQKTTRSFEVYALDSGSKDDTLEVLRAHPVRIISIDPQSFDWGRLRHRLFQEARGRIVVNLSQDAIPADLTWLDRLVAPLEDPQVGAASGSSIPDPHREFPQFQWEKNGHYYFTREIGKFVARYGKGMSFGNTAVPKAVWERLGISPQATGEDFGFQMRLHAAGLKIAFPQDAPVWHHHNYTLQGVFRRCRNEGLALREMGCAYNEFDLLVDLLQSRKNIQWAREIRYARLHSAAEWLYPVLRPVAVYVGSRFAQKMVWY